MHVFVQCDKQACFLTRGCVELNGGNTGNSFGKKGWTDGAQQKDRCVIVAGDSFTVLVPQNPEVIWDGFIIVDWSVQSIFAWGDV